MLQKNSMSVPNSHDQGKLLIFFVACYLQTIWYQCKTRAEGQLQLQSYGVMQYSQQDLGQKS